MPYNPWNKGKRLSKETCLKMSRSRMGHVVSAETRKKIGDANRGKKRSPEEAERCRQLAIGNKNMLGKRHTEESKGKMRQAALRYKEKNPNFNKGENHGMYGVYGDKHHSWKGGTSTLHEYLRKRYEFTNWRNQVYERDNYICWLCSKQGGYLHPHHILPFADFPESRYDVDNGMTLCDKHHKIIHSKIWKKVYNSAFESKERF